MGKEMKLVVTKDKKVIAQEIESDEEKKEEIVQEPVSAPETSEPEVESSEPTLSDNVNETIKNVEIQTEEVRSSALKLAGLRTLFIEKKGAELEKEYVRGADKLDRAVRSLDSAVDSMINEGEKIDSLDKKQMPRDEVKMYDGLLSEAEQAEQNADSVSFEADVELKNAKTIFSADEDADKEKKEKEDKKKEEADKKKEDEKKEKEDKKDEKKGGISDLLKAKIKEIRAIRAKRAMKKKALYPEKQPTSEWGIKNENAQTAKAKYPKIYDKKDLVHYPEGREKLQQYGGELKEFEGKAGDPSKVKDYKKLTARAIEQAVKDHDLKVRRALDMAAEQQFKSLIDDPLKDSLKSKLEESGVDKAIVEEAVNSAYFDNAEASFQGVLHQALDNIINFDDKSFLKLAKVVRDTKIAIDEDKVVSEEQSVDPAEESNEVIDTPDTQSEEKVSRRKTLRKRIAAIKQQVPLISGRSASVNDEGELYKSYFNDKRVDYRNGLRN